MKKHHVKFRNYSPNEYSDTVLQVAYNAGYTDGGKGSQQSLSIYQNDGSQYAAYLKGIDDDQDDTITDVPNPITIPTYYYLIGIALIGLIVGIMIKTRKK